MTADLAYLSLAEAAALLGRKKLSPVDLAQAMLGRIERVDAGLGSFITVEPARVLGEARDAERAIMAGDYRGPLHGIPVALKDAYDTAGVRTTVGSRLHADRVPAKDSFAWARLRAAGAILLGKLELTEFCFGGPSPDSLFPAARNPWDRSRYAGGSSSGAGVALAAGLCYGALGTDTGGSIRLPAAYCGITGLMASTGLISRTGVFPLSYTFDHFGPMARSAEDCAIMLNALVGHDPEDPTSVAPAARDYRRHLGDGARGLRIGYVREFAAERYVSPAMSATTDRAADVLKDLGATVTEARLSDLSDYAACQMVITLAEGFAIHEHELRRRRQDFSYYTRMRLSLAPFLSSADYVHAQRLRRTLIERYDAVMDRFDVLLLPGAPGGAPAAAAVGAFDFWRKPLVTVPANVVGVAAISVPAGFTDDPLPLAVQFMGRRFGEADVLRAAHAFQQATDWHRRRPPL